MFQVIPEAKVTPGLHRLFRGRKAKLDILVRRDIPEAKELSVTQALHQLLSDIPEVKAIKASLVILGTQDPSVTQVLEAIPGL